MTIMNFNEIVDAVKANKKPQPITARELFNYLNLSRRTRHNCNRVDKFLSDNNLEVFPHYHDVWIDHKIELRHKPIAGRKLKNDPIKRLHLLQSATTTPTTIHCDAALNEATTIMMLNKFSQLPVLSSAGNLRSLCGYITWETIGNAVTHGVNSGLVKDYMSDEIRTLTLDTPMLKAIGYVHKHEFVFVVDKQKLMCGVLTTADISSQYLSITEPFILLEQIENFIRILLDDIFLIEDIRKLCVDGDNKQINNIDDLTFGQYIKIFENPDNWKKININCDKKLFVKYLDEVRQIRNDLMHFEPDGISAENQLKLRQVSDFLHSIAKHK